MPNLIVRLAARLKAVAQVSGDLAEILSQTSGPAESPRPAETVHAEAQGRSGPATTSCNSDVSKLRLRRRGLAGISLHVARL
jgi:hypothetical protein